MLKSSVSICAALILAAAAFSAPAQAQRGGHGGGAHVGGGGARIGGGGAHFGGARVGGFSGARVGGAGLASRGYAYRGGYGGRYYGGGYGGRYYGGGWGYYGGGLAAGAILGGLLAAPYYGGGYYDGYGYDGYGYGYEVPVYVEPAPRYYYGGYRSGVNCLAISPGSPNFGACN